MGAEAVLVRHVRGFTLIEALVALAILAVALAAALRPAGTAPFVLSPEPISLRRVEDLVARAHAESLARAATERAVATLEQADDFPLWKVLLFVTSNASKYDILP